MAEILIKGMEMPKNCNKCPFEKSKKEKREYIWFCSLTNTECENVLIHNKGCPLIEIKTPHGRLIDADKLKEATKNTVIQNSSGEVYQIGKAITMMIDQAPVVVEAST